MDWTTDELAGVGHSTELHLASYGPDDVLGPFTTMWVVRVGDVLYVRSAGGPTRPWYRRARASGRGRVRAGGVDVDVDFADAAADAGGAIDTAYHQKYDRFGPGPVGAVTGNDAHAVTIRLIRSAP
jgi:hypothetical protein